MKKLIEYNYMLEKTNKSIYTFLLLSSVVITGISFVCTLILVV